MSDYLNRSYRLIIATSLAMLFTTACEMVPVLQRSNPSRVVSTTLPSPPVLNTLEPPSRVARVSYLQGSVSFQAAGTETWARAELNRPLAEGDAVWTDGAASAELELGSAAIRMDSRTRLDFLTFGDRMVQTRVIRGIISVTVRRLAAGEIFEIDTPNAAVTFLQSGQYRIDIQPPMDSTFVTVRTGDAEVSGTRIEFTVHPGQRANVAGPDPMEWGLAAAPAPDEFDEFCQLHDHREDFSASAQYVAPDTIGYSDLDQSGTWHQVGAWGVVWTPRSLPAGWAPYRFGHWTWVELWGWTWIDDAPWGFAPFHYGRWMFLDGGWSWIPGPRRVRPIYAPALAIFVDRLGGARVAWFPLGPGEVYVPPYRCGPSYLASINIGNTLHAYTNRSVSGAVTAVPRETFVRGRPVADAAAKISARQAASVRVIGTAPLVAPIEQSLSPQRDRFVLEPPQVAPDQTVVARRDPALALIPFHQRQAVLNAHPGRPLDQQELESLRKADVVEPARCDVRPARLSALEHEPVPSAAPAR
jgi:hypothetical protein